jgi:hypothetical protein
MYINRLTSSEIEDIVRAALKAVLPRTKIDRIKIGENDLGPDPGVRITVVFTAGDSVNLTGQQLVSVQQQVIDKMSEEDDDRFPYLRYLTAKEAKQLAF